MAEDARKMNDDNEIVKENQELEAQYEALTKEIAEKSELMSKAIEEKETQGSTLEEEMNSKILNQEEEIKKNVEIYKEQTTIKQREEKELLAVYKDYKDKYEQFVKALKKGKDSFKVFEQEIRALNSRIQQLQKQKKDL